MMRLVVGIVMMAGVIWMSACAPVDPPPGGGGAAAAKPPGPTGPFHRGGMMDDEMDFGRSYQ